MIKFWKKMFACIYTTNAIVKFCEVCNFFLLQYSENGIIEGILFVHMIVKTTVGVRILKLSHFDLFSGRQNFSSENWNVHQQMHHHAKIHCKVA